MKNIPQKNWSGIRESNSRLHLGKVAYYHYTNPAYKIDLSSIYSMPPTTGQGPAESCFREISTVESSRRKSASACAAESQPMRLIDFQNASRLDYR